MLRTSALTDEIRRITIGGRDFDLDVTANRLRPVICGGSDIPPAPPAPPPAPPAPAPTPPAPPAPDLTALQAALDAAQAQGNTVGTTALLKALGFDKLEDAQAFVTAQREAIEKGKDSDTKAREAVEARERAAVELEAAAKKLIERGVIREALRGAGVPAEVLDDAEGLIRIDGDVTIEIAIAAAETLKAKPAFVSLFAPGTPTPGTPAPSGGVVGGPPAAPPIPATGIAAAREKHRQEREGKGEAPDLLASIRPKSA